MVHQSQQHTFGASIGCAVLLPPPGMGRTGKNDRSSACFPHMVHCVLAAEKCGTEVDIHNNVKCGLVAGIQRRNRCYAGIIKESVYSAILRSCFIEEFFAILHIC